MKKNKLEKLLSESSVIIVIVPAVAFLMAYVYKVGFFLYFKIPLSFLVVSAKDVSIMAAILVVCMLILISIETVLSAIILDPFFRKYEKDNVMAEQQYDLYCSFLAFLLIDIALLALGFFWPMILVVSIPIVIIPIQFLVRHKKYNPEIKTIPSPKKQKHYYCPSLSFSILGLKTITVVIVVAGIVLFTTMFGVRMASLKTTFYNIDGSNEIVGIVINNDHIVAKRVDDESLKETIIVRMEDTCVIKDFKSEEFYMLVHKQNEEYDYLSLSNLFQKKMLGKEETKE